MTRSPTLRVSRQKLEGALRKVSPFLKCADGVLMFSVYTVDLALGSSLMTVEFNRHLCVPCSSIHREIPSFISSTIENGYWAEIIDPYPEIEEWGICRHSVIKSYFSDANFNHICPFSSVRFLLCSLLFSVMRQAVNWANGPLLKLKICWAWCLWGF